MKRMMVAVAAVVLMAGCARFSTKQVDVSYSDEGKPVRKTTTRASSHTFLDSKSALTAFKANQTDKSQGTSVGSLTQETTGTNALEVVHAIERIVQAVK